MTIPKKVGEGTYGCVYNPSLQCNSELKKYNYKNRVSKVMTKRDALNEMKEYKNINKIKDLDKYAITTPIHCIPKYDEILQKSLKQCNNDKIKKIYDYDIFYNIKKPSISLLLLENGGINLYDYMKKIFHNQKPDEQKIFLTSLIDLFNGLNFFKKNNIIHRDIKLLNIVYNVNTGKSKYIDFGLMVNRLEFIKNCKNSNEPLAISWSYLPPENSCINKKAFDFLNKCKKYKNKYENYDIFIEDVADAFDIYCLSLALIYMLKELIKDKKYETFALYFARDLGKYLNKELYNRNINIDLIIKNYTELLKKHNLYSVKKPNPKDNTIYKVESVYKKSLEKELGQKKCSKDKPIYNNITKRCLKKCKDGYVRNETFKCVKIITDKKSINKKTSKKPRCPNGTRRNKKTGLCESKN